MNINQAGLDLIQEFEGLRLEAYQDSNGIWTIGNGHTQGVKEGDTCTKEQAQQWLAEDCHRAETCIQQSVSYPLTENEFSALVSFVFNVGPGRKANAHDSGRDGFVYLRNGEPSTLLKLLNDGRIDECAAQFGRWVHAGGKIEEGLVKRRQAEAQLFEA